MSSTYKCRLCCFIKTRCIFYNIFYARRGYSLYSEVNLNLY
jgi:hypothetical protein